MTRKIASADIFHAAELINGGSKLKDAAAIIGCHPSVLSQKLKAIGVYVPRVIPSAHNKIVDFPFSDMILQYSNGITEQRLAEIYGVNRGVIKRILIENGITRRGISEANTIRMSRLSPSERKELVAAGREKRFSNLIDSANNKTAHYAIGAGEKEIADDLEAIGYKIKRQTECCGYYIDITIGNIAIEIKKKASLAFTAKSKRTECLIKSGYIPLFVIANSDDIFINNRNQVVELINAFCANPPSVGEYGVIRCCLKTTASGFNNYNFSSVMRPY